MKKIIHICCMGMVYLFAGNNHAAAQTKPPKAETLLPDTGKIISFTTRFGPYDGKTPVPLDDIKKVLNGQVTITDNKGTKWKVFAWRFGWNRLEPSDDWKTGQRKTIKTYQAVELKATSSLPETWQKALKEGLQKGEEILIEALVAEHPKTGQKRFAPELRLKIF